MQAVSLICLSSPDCERRREACATRQYSLHSEVEKNAEPLSHYLAAGEARRGPSNGVSMRQPTFIHTCAKTGGRRNSNLVVTVNL